MEKHNGLLVTFEEPLRDDEVREMRQALLKFRHVVSVDTVPDDSYAYTIRAQVRNELGTKMMEVLFPELKKDK